MKAISSKVNINVSMYKFKYYVKLFLLENELMITTKYLIVLFFIDESLTFDIRLNVT